MDHWVGTLLKYPNFSDFANSDDCIAKITSKFIRLQPVANYWKKYLKLIKKKFQWKTEKFRYLIVFMITVTRFLERIFNALYLYMHIFQHLYIPTYFSIQYVYLSPPTQNKLPTFLNEISNRIIISLSYYYLKYQIG